MPNQSLKISNLNPNQYLYVTLVLIIFILLLLFSWIYSRLSLKTRTCDKLKIYWPTLTNTTYFLDTNHVKSSDFDSSSNRLINFQVKSAYNCCCGDSYKNNFVALCALEKCITNGCRFLDFEIYSYNNEPIIASSTANNNYIKETYNSLLLEEVLTTITDRAFDATTTNCASDPLILNFRVMSTNLAMLKKMGELLEEYLKNNEGAFTYETKTEEDLLFTKMDNFHKKVIVICDFNPSPAIVDTNTDLIKLKNCINLKAKGLNCNTFRYNQIASKKGSLSFIEETKKKFTIVLPNLDNSIINFDPELSFDMGCQAICMKHQNIDNNLLGYNARFKLKQNYSWIKKPNTLLNVDMEEVPNYTGTGERVV
jgi:hypothetical protein